MSHCVQNVHVPTGLAHSVLGKPAPTLPVPEYVLSANAFTRAVVALKTARSTQCFTSSDLIFKSKFIWLSRHDLPYYYMAIMSVHVYHLQCMILYSNAVCVTAGLRTLAMKCCYYCIGIIDSECPAGCCGTKH